MIHAAVVARGMGVLRCRMQRVKINEQEILHRKNSKKYVEALDLTGRHRRNVYGEASDSRSRDGGDFATFMAWADEIRSLKVRINADTLRTLPLSQVRCRAEPVPYGAHVL